MSSNAADEMKETGKDMLYTQNSGIESVLEYIFPLKVWSKRTLYKSPELNIWCLG